MHTATADATPTGGVVVQRVLVVLLLHVMCGCGVVCRGIRRMRVVVRVVHGRLHVVMVGGCRMVVRRVAAVVHRQHVARVLLLLVEVLQGVRVGVAVWRRPGTWRATTATRSCAASRPGATAGRASAARWGG